MITVAQLIEELERALEDGEVQEDDVVLLTVSKPVMPEPGRLEKEYADYRYYANAFESFMDQVTDPDTGVPKLARVYNIRADHRVPDESWEAMFEEVEEQLASYYQSHHETGHVPMWEEEKNRN